MGPRWAHTASATGWGESTFAEIAWDKIARGGGAAGPWPAACRAGRPAGLRARALAASAIASATNQHLLLADARGTLWSGSAVVVLTGDPGSRDASALPGRLDWTIGIRAWASSCAPARPAASTARPLQVKPASAA